jgi:hypothetical protein
MEGDDDDVVRTQPIYLLPLKPEHVQHIEVDIKRHAPLYKI